MQVVYLSCSCFEILFYVSFFIFYNIYEIHIIFIFALSFSGLLSLAVMCPCKVLYVSLVVLKGGSGVGAHMYYEQIQLISTWHV